MAFRNGEEHDGRDVSSVDRGDGYEQPPLGAKERHTKVEELSDRALLSSLRAMLGSEHRLLARLLVHLIEVEERRLHLRAAYSSMYDFCIRRLGLSEGEAYRRITAARLVRRFPHILGRIERGQIHLSALVLLRDHLTDDNHEELVGAACGKSKREVQELLAARSPQPDVPARIRKLRSAAPAATPMGHQVPLRASPERRDVEPDAGAKQRPGQTPTPNPDSGCVPTPAPRPKAATTRAVIEPLSEARYKLQLTIDAELRAALERATRLMSHANPSGDLVVVMKRALALLIADLEKTKLGKTTGPRRRPTQTPTKQGYVTRTVRRAVIARDGEQCSFVDERGERCPARSFLQLDHIRARALGGTDDTANVRLRCHAHNQLYAEQVFGRDVIERHIQSSRRKSVRKARAPADVADASRSDEAATKPSELRSSDDCSSSASASASVRKMRTRSQS